MLEPLPPRCSELSPMDIHIGLIGLLMADLNTHQRMYSREQILMALEQNERPYIVRHADGRVSVAQGMGS